MSTVKLAFAASIIGIILLGGSRLLPSQDTNAPVRGVTIALGCRRVPAYCLSIGHPAGERFHRHHRRQRFGRSRGRMAHRRPRQA